MTALTAIAFVVILVFVFVVGVLLGFSEGLKRP